MTNEWTLTAEAVNEIRAIVEAEKDDPAFQVHLIVSVLATMDREIARERAVRYLHKIGTPQEAAHG